MYVYERGTLDLGGRENREEHERVVADVVGPVHDTLRDVRAVAGLQLTVRAIHPLFGRAGLHVDDLFHLGMRVELVSPSGRHANAHHEQAFRVGEPRTRDPLVWTPGRLLNFHVRASDVPQILAHRPANVRKGSTTGNTSDTLVAGSSTSSVWNGSSTWVSSTASVPRSSRSRQ